MRCARDECDSTELTTKTATLRARSRVHVVLRFDSLDLGFHVVIGVGCLNVQQDGFTAQVQHQVRSSFLLDVAVRLFPVIVHSICIPNSCIFLIAKTGLLRCCLYTPVGYSRPPSAVNDLPVTKQVNSGKSCLEEVSQLLIYQVALINQYWVRLHGDFRRKKESTMILASSTMYEFMKAICLRFSPNFSKQRVAPFDRKPLLASSLIDFL